MRSLLQSGLDKRRDVPGVPQHWTVQASRHVHWAKHPTDALADALPDNSRADPVTDALADNSVTDNSITDTVSDSIAYSITHALADSTTVANKRSHELFFIAIKHPRAGGLPA